MRHKPEKNCNIKRPNAVTQERKRNDDNPASAAGKQNYHFCAKGCYLNEVTIQAMSRVHLLIYSLTRGVNGLKQDEHSKNEKCQYPSTSISNTKTFGVARTSRSQARPEMTGRGIRTFLFGACHVNRLIRPTTPRCGLQCPIDLYLAVGGRPTNFTEPPAGWPRRLLKFFVYIRVV
ncbi:hypothetical protein EVAR_56123_1 [Eumeta japonica]|uniref:Uncharacterized protein n=1 Tax=Eumeta variegata TaxID=151549 RepID=A0A4C1Z6X3_EUMVA|nr:hypothetical protein EVAR_56123_1 [Eumeta japonica]